MRPRKKGRAAAAPPADSSDEEGSGGPCGRKQDTAVRVVAGGAVAKRPRQGAGAKRAAARGLKDSSDESDSSEGGAAVGRAIAKQQGAAGAGKAVAKRPCTKRARDSSDEGMDSSAEESAPFDSSDDEACASNGSKWQKSGKKVL